MDSSDAGEVRLATAYVATVGNRSKRWGSLKWFVLFVAGFCMFVTPVLNVSGRMLGSLDVYVGVWLILVALRRVVTVGIPASVVWTLVSVVAASSYVGVLFVLSNMGDFTGLALFVKLVPLVFAAYGFAVWCTRWFGKRAFRTFLDIAFWVVFIQGLVLWLSFASPDVRALLDRVFYRDYSAGIDLITLRVPGFVPTGGDGLSMNHSLVACLAAVGLIYRQGWRAACWFAVLVGVVAANIVTGRSGLVIGGLILPGMWLVCMRVPFRTLLVIVASVGVGVYVLWLIYAEAMAVYSWGLAQEIGYQHPIVRTLEVFRARLEGGNPLGGWATALLSDMIKVPDSLGRFIFGNGDYGQLPRTSIGSDIGYVRGLFGMGLIGSGLGLLVVLTPVLACRKTLRSTLSLPGIPRHRHRDVWRSVVLILLFGLLGHWKIFYLQTRVFAFVLFTLCFLIEEQRSVGLAWRPQQPGSARHTTTA